MKVVNWSELYPELLELIARKFTISDYIRFRAVCVKWHSSVPPKPHHLPCQFPWLMLPSHPQDDNRHGFYDLSENKIYQFNISNSRLGPRRYCVGSSQGWLLLSEDRGPTLLLFNPLTRIEIHLPPLTALPRVWDFRIDDVGDEYLLQSYQSPDGDHYLYTYSFYAMRNSFISNFVLSSSPTSPNEDYVAVVVIGVDSELAFCKKGDEKWTMIQDAKDCEDVIYFKALFYALNMDESVSVWDISGVSPTVTKIATPPHPIIYHHNKTKRYRLVESFGELLLVRRLFCRVGDESDHTEVFKTVDFEVLKLDLSKPEWLKVTNLGDRMLFLGRNSSLCLLATNFSGLKGNCIYFTVETSMEVRELCSTDDYGVFNLGDKSVKALPNYTGREGSLLPPSVWVTPNPC